MKKLFNDEWSDDLSEFRIISIEDLNKGFTSTSKQFLVNPDDSPDFRSKFHDYKNTPTGNSYLTDNPVSVFPYTGVDEDGKKGYEYRASVLPCENGSQVLGSYNANKREPQSLFLFYEKPNSKKSNFSGDFYIAKMGDYFVSLFKKFPEPLPSTVGGKFFKNITSLEDEAAYLTQLAYTYEGDKINATLVRDALMREYQFYTGDRRFQEIIGNIVSIPADAIGWCAEQLEDFKPTEKNYNPEAEDYSPLVPILMGRAVIPVPINMNKAAQFFENLGSNPFLQGTEVAFNQVWELVKRAADKVKDASIEHLSDAFKGLIEKISSIINSIKSFLGEANDELTEMAKKGIEFLKLVNAFYCGFNWGLISLIQCLLYILEFLLQPTITFSYQQYLERRDLMEKAEEVIDWITENAPKFLQGIKDLFKTSGNISQSDMEGILDKMKEYFGDISRYTAAFYVGIFAFELLINILLLIFTGGVGNLAKGSTHVQKAASLLKVLVRESFSVATLGITDLLAFLSRFIVRFGKACAKGFKGFIKFIEELLKGAKNGAKAEDLAMTAEEIEEIALRGKKAQSVFNILASARIGFKKLGIEILAKADGYLLKWKEKPIFKGDFKEVNAFWNKILKPRLGAGTGGALRYKKILSNEMAKQELPMSCTAACIKEFLKKFKIDKTEDEIRKLIDTNFYRGTDPGNAHMGLESLLKGHDYRGERWFDPKMKDKEIFLQNIEDVKESFITYLHDIRDGRHTVIVEKVDLINKEVIIKDPWPEGVKNSKEFMTTKKDKGVVGIVDLDHFIEEWAKGGSLVFRTK